MFKVTEVFRELKEFKAYRVSKVLTDSLLDKVFKVKRDCRELKVYKVLRVL